VTSNPKPQRSASTPRYEGRDRRRLSDRREFGLDRRRAERRVRVVMVALERRGGGDRRVRRDRRTGVVRRTDGQNSNPGR
jgi:hypothetical protein